MLVTAFGLHTTTINYIQQDSLITFTSSAISIHAPAGLLIFVNGIKIKKLP